MPPIPLGKDYINELENKMSTPSSEFTAKVSTSLEDTRNKPDLTVEKQTLIHGLITNVLPVFNTLTIDANTTAPACPSPTGLPVIPPLTPKQRLEAEKRARELLASCGHHKPAKRAPTPCDILAQDI